MRPSRVLVTAVLLAVGVAGCGSPSRPGSTGPAGSGGSSAATSTATSSSPTAIPSGTATTKPSAAEQLAAFFAAAGRQDAQLRAAARLINAGIGSSTITLTPQTKAAVKAIDPAVVARTIPAGLDPTLQLAVLVVYSELDSRRQAMRRVDDWALYPGTSVLPKNGTGVSGGVDLLRCLANGAPGAARYAGDLAAARALAQRTAAFTPASPRSRAAADLAVRVAFINGENAGCASCGGFVATRLEPVTWRSMTVAGIHWDGVIGASNALPNGGLRFQAGYVAGKGWQVQLNAC